MSPDELRAAADQLTRYVGRIPGSPHDPDYLNAWAAAEAAARLADVIEYAELEASWASAQKENRLWAKLQKILRIAREETTSNEDRRER